jgi:oligosaccharide repeat unit polymerase
MGRGTIADALHDRQRSARMAVAPMMAYVLAFMAALATYSVGWSAAYPPLSWQLLAFIGATCVACLCIALPSLLLRARARAPSSSWWTARKARWTVAVIYALTALECLHAGGVPLLQLLTGADYDYREFGIPTLHVVLFGIYNFLAVHFFSVFLRSGDRRFLWACISLLLLNLLIVNRGAVVQSLLAVAVLFLVRRRINLRAVAVLLVALGAGIYLFGAVGDSRMIAMGLDPDQSITVIGDATDGYPAATLGSGPFWVYLYSSSPLANWQLNVSMGGAANAPLSTFIALEVLPDFVAKRLVPEEVFELSPHLIVDALTVTTAYGRAYFLWGWVGSTVVFSLLLAYYAAARWVFRGSEYFDSVLATMTAGAALMIYYNMLTFAGFVGPLAIAVVLRIACVRRLRAVRSL